MDEFAKTMKKPPKFKKPNLNKVKIPLRRAKSAEDKVNDALSNVPRITNETVTEHREEVLSSARKYIYPLQQSKHRVVKVSLTILTVLFISFFAFVGLSLYKFQSTSGFIYDVTKIVPFPVAKAGTKWVSYESYLFELRRKIHYYQSQQQATFKTKDGKAQLSHLKHQAMDQVIEDAYVKQLATKNGVSISNQAVDNELSLVRSQARLGSNDRVLRDTLNKFWGWNVSDFKRELKQQLLKQAVIAKLDTKTQARAESVLVQLKSGVDFGALANAVSDDINTKANGGQYAGPLTLNSHSISSTLAAEIFKLKPGQTSGIINSGNSLDIVKVIEKQGTSVRAAHIQFNLHGVDTYINPLKKDHPSRQYIKL